MAYDSNMQARHQRFANLSNLEGGKPTSNGLKLDSMSLDLLCKAVVTCNPHFKRSHLINIKTLLDHIDPEVFQNDSSKEKIDFIKKGLRARLDYNLTNRDMIIMHINGGILDNSIIANNFVGLNNAELHWLNDMVSESLKHAWAYAYADKMMETCNKIKNAEYGSKAQAIKEFENVTNEIQTCFRRSKNEQFIEGEFTLEDGGFESIMYDTYNAMASPSRKLITGMQAMNELLGGGFENGRVYVVFGLPGEGKSTILLNFVYQIKKYNKKIQTKDPTKRPCIVLLTMENQVSESIVRLFSMATRRENMIDYTVEDVIKMMREEGELFLSNDSPINIIIRFKPSNSVTTNELYTIVDDLEDRGFETICMVQDYIGRIRSTEKNQEIRLEYGSIVDEFKTFAEAKDIPVITAGQLNRDASRHIDEAKQKHRSDLVRTLGRSNVSESTLILNNCDAAYVIAPEYSTQEQKYYLGIQKIKGRFKGTDLEYAYLPFGKGGRMELLEDVNSIPNFKTSLNAVPFTTVQSNSVYDPASNIKDSEFGMSFMKDTNSIFSTTPLGEASHSKFKIKLKSPYPMEFFDSRSGSWV